MNRVKLIANVNPTMPLINQKPKITQFYKDKKYEFIISFIKGDYSENIYLQNLKTSDISFNLDDLMFDRDTVNSLRKLIKLPYGLIIITGGTKIRKTVVSYGLLKEIITDFSDIYTVEDEQIEELKEDENLEIDFSDLWS